MSQQAGTAAGYQRPDSQEKGVSSGDRLSCISHFVPMEPITEQSTVTVLVASSLCCCMLFLASLALGVGYLFLLFWGIFILEDNE